jgi:hypothetical protein
LALCARRERDKTAFVAFAPEAETLVPARLLTHHALTGGGRHLEVSMDVDLDSLNVGITTLRTVMSIFKQVKEMLP